MFGNFNWTAATIANVHTTYKLPPHLVAHLTKANLAPAIDQLKALDTAVIQECFNDCPDSWGISETDKQAAANYAIHSKNGLARKKCLKTV